MKKLICSLFIFLIVFTTAAVTTTHLLISNNKLDDSNGKTQPHEPGIDLYGTFDQNDLIINSTDHMYNTIYMELDQIGGLKNSAIQDKINNAIKKDTEEFLDTLGNSGNIESAFVNISIGFANILPVTFTAKYFDSTCEITHFTYNLLDGELVKLEDIFTKNADIQAIVRDAFYKTILENSYQETEFWNSDDDEYLEPTDNNELYKTVKGYMSRDKKDFEIHPYRIYFYYNELSSWVDMIDIADSVAIYDRYITEESLFADDNIGKKNIVNCASDNFNGWLNIEYGYLQNNLWYDITIHEDMIFETVSDSFVKTIRDEQYAGLDEYIETAKNNPDKFYVVLQRSYINKYNENSLTVATKTTWVEMPMEVFESSYKEVMYTAYRRNPLTPGVNYTVDCGAIIDHASIKGVSFTEEITKKDFDNLTEIVLETEG